MHRDVRVVEPPAGLAEPTGQPATAAFVAGSPPTSARPRPGWTSAAAAATSDAPPAAAPIAASDDLRQQQHPPAVVPVDDVPGRQRQQQNSGITCTSPTRPRAVLESVRAYSSHPTATDHLPADDAGGVPEGEEPEVADAQGGVGVVAAGRIDRFGGGVGGGGHGWAGSFGPAGGSSGGPPPRTAMAFRLTRRRPALHSRLHRVDPGMRHHIWQADSERRRNMARVRRMVSGVWAPRRARLPSATGRTRR